MHNPFWVSIFLITNASSQLSLQRTIISIGIGTRQSDSTSSKCKEREREIVSTFAPIAAVVPCGFLVRDLKPFLVLKKWISDDLWLKFFLDILAEEFGIHLIASC